MKKILAFSAATFSPAATAFAHGNNNFPMGNWDHMMGWGFGGMFMWLIFLIIIVAGVYLIVKGGRSQTPSGGLPGESALDILKKRYARGEINKEDFDRMKKDIES